MKNHNLKKFCMPPLGKRLNAYIIVCGIFAVLFFVSLSGLIPDSIAPWLIPASLVTLIICRHHMAVIPRRRLDRKIAACKKNGTLDIVLRDFNTGTRISKGSLILGQDCMFGEGYGLFVFYREIEKYGIRITHEHKSDSNSDTDEVVFHKFLDVCIEGRWYCLCEYFENQNHGAGMRFPEFLRSKNSSIVYEKRN